MAILELSNTRRGRRNLDELEMAQGIRRIEVRFKSPQKIKTGHLGKEFVIKGMMIGAACNVFFDLPTLEGPETRIYYTTSETKPESRASVSVTHHVDVKTEEIKLFIVWLNSFRAEDAH